MKVSRVDGFYKIPCSISFEFDSEFPTFYLLQRWKCFTSNIFDFFETFYEQFSNVPPFESRYFSLVKYLKSEIYEFCTLSYASREISTVPLLGVSTFPRAARSPLYDTRIYFKSRLVSAPRSLFRDAAWLRRFSAHLSNIWRRSSTLGAASSEIDGLRLSHLRVPTISMSSRMEVIAIWYKIRNDNLVLIGLCVAAASDAEWCVPFNRRDSGIVTIKWNFG